MIDLTALTDEQLAASRAAAWKVVHAHDAEKARRRAVAVEAKGWTRCCRCFPRMVGADGFCGCCMMNHATGVRIEMSDPDFDAPLELDYSDGTEGAPAVSAVSEKEQP